MMVKRLAWSVGLAFGLCVATGAGATPFTVQYGITDLGSDGFQYDFQLILDNNDGTWVSGQAFDAFVFGVQADSKDAFGAFGTWSWESTPDGFTGGTTFGLHNGPTLFFGGGSLEPWYQPTSIGETVVFSGIGGNELGQGDLLWSNIAGSPGATLADFETAVLTTPTPIPVPGALLLLVTAMGGLFGLARLRAASNGAGRAAATPA